MCAGCHPGNQDLSREEGIPLEGESGLAGEESMLHLAVRAPARQEGNLHKRVSEPKLHEVGVHIEEEPTEEERRENWSQTGASINK